MQVLVRDNNVDQALKALKKKMQREGIFREMKLRGHYEKPSEKRAREKAEAVRRARKLARKKLQREGLLPMKPKPVPGAGPGPGDELITAPVRALRLERAVRRGTLMRIAFPSLVLMTAMAFALGGCETMTSATAPNVAERDPDNAQTASANIASLSEVLERRPNDPVAFNQRGIAYAKNGHYAEAISDFSHAVKLDPKFAGAYTNRALAYRQTSKDDLALADFNSAIVANPNYEPAYLGRGNLLRSQGHLDDALADLNSAIRLKPEDAQPFSRARAHLPAQWRLRARDQRLQQRHRPQSVRRFALSGAWAVPDLDGQIRRGDRGFQRRAQCRQPQCGRLGQPGASLTRSRATAPRRSSPTIARWRSIRRNALAREGLRRLG